MLPADLMNFGNAVDHFLGALFQTVWHGFEVPSNKFIECNILRVHFDIYIFMVGITPSCCC